MAVTTCQWAGPMATCMAVTLVGPESIKNKIDLHGCFTCKIVSGLYTLKQVGGLLTSGFIIKKRKEFGK